MENKTLPRVVIEAVDNGTLEGRRAVELFTERLARATPSHPHGQPERQTEIVARITLTMYAPEVEG